MRNEQMDAIEKALKRELKHLPIPVLIFYSDHPEHVERLIQLYEMRGNEKEMKFLERLERIRVYWDQHHRVPKYGWDEDGYMLKQ